MGDEVVEVRRDVRGQASLTEEISSDESVVADRCKHEDARLIFLRRLGHVRAAEGQFDRHGREVPEYR